MNHEIGFIALTFFNIIGSIVMFCGLCSERMRTFPAWHKFGMVLLIIGLLSQVFRNIIYLMTGVSPTDSSLPLWAFKDVGIDVIALQYAVIAIERIIDSNKPTPPTPSPRIRKYSNETSTDKPTASVRKRSTSNSNKT